MLTTPRAIAAALAATVAVGVGAPVASASTWPTPSFTTPAGAFSFPQMPQWGGSPNSGANGGAAGAGPCGTATGEQGFGAMGGTTAEVCTGSGLVFVGPAIGAIASVVGPTIIGPAVVGNLVVSAGTGNIG
jgi:hypothetical protein